MRPIVIWRDLAPVADLIQLAFADELRLAGHSGEEFWFLKRFAPLIAVLALFSPQIRNSLRGFVWEEDGHIVGNVSVSQTSTPHVWLIGNVAVHPAYRRRGIARRLTEHAIDFCARQGAEVVALEVRRDNTPAYTLYERLGFTLYDSTTRLHRRGVPLAIPPQLPADLSLRPEMPADWPRIDRLVHRTCRREIPALGLALQLDRSPTPLGHLIGQIGDALSGRRIDRFVLVGDQTDQLYARLCLVTSRTRAPHRITLIVDPIVQGRFERLLAQAALARLPESALATVLAEIRTAHAASIAAFQAVGFEIAEVLDALIVRPDALRC